MPIKNDKLGPGSLVFGDVGSEQEFAARLTNARLEPSVKSDDAIDVLDGSQLEGDEVLTWELSGTLLQSFDADSLGLWCYENRLTTVPFKFIPNDEETQTWSGQARITPVTIGGDVKKRNTADFTFRCIGEPVPGTLV